jgi:hypothetical protein|eukprot:COSAG06_NODE_8912_length_2033_cov_7.864529_2_plen_70_part_00
MWQPGLGAERRHTAAPAGAPGASRPNGGLQRLHACLPCTWRLHVSRPADMTSRSTDDLAWRCLSAAGER